MSIKLHRGKDKADRTIIVVLVLEGKDYKIQRVVVQQGQQDSGIGY